MRQTQDNNQDKANEWLFAALGVACAALTYSTCTFITLQIAKDVIGVNYVAKTEGLIFWVLMFSVPLGAGLGLLTLTAGFHHRGRIKIPRKTMLSSWLLASLIGYPIALVWLGWFAFSMPDEATAVGLSAIYLVAALIGAFAFGATS